MALTERFAYNAYGLAEHRYFDDIDIDGDVDSAASNPVSSLDSKDITLAAYNADADKDDNDVKEVMECLNNLDTTTPGDGVVSPPKEWE